MNIRQLSLTLLCGPIAFGALAPSGNSVAEASPATAEVQAYAYTRPTGRRSTFIVPPELRKRVDFWKDVFTKYGKYQQIIHHREFPQIRFGIIDLSEEGESMHPVEFDKYKKAETERRIKEVHRVLRKLAQGGRATTLLEDVVMREMRSLPGGNQKYLRAVDEDLVRTQTGIRERYAEAVKRSGRYMPFMEDIFVKEFDLPVELTRLPFIESSFDYTAYSSVGAAGIWQFMPRTAKGYKMRVTTTVDDRRDPILATRGAAQYLRDAYKALGAWPLAVTSYNHGVGGVNKRIREYGTTDLVKLIEHPTARPFGFASSNFYPEFLAAVEIYQDWKRYFPGLVMDPPVHVTRHRLPTAASVQHVARQLKVDVESLRSVNYALSDGVWKGRFKIPAGYEIRVPHGVSVQTALLREEEPAAAVVKSKSSSSVYGGVTYTVRKGDTVSSIAKKYKIGINDLKSYNNLTGSSIRVGQTLTVRPRAVPTPIFESKAAPAKGAALPAKPQDGADAPRAAQSYRVESGDTLFSLSRRFNTTVEVIKRTNRLKSNNLSVGQTLVLP